VSNTQRSQAITELRVEGDEATVAPSGGEHFEAMHGNVRPNVDRIGRLEVVLDPIEGISWLEIAGTSVSGMTAVGTFRRDGKRIDAVVHHRAPRGLRIELEDGPFDEIVLGLDDPESARASLEAARAAGGER